MNKEQQALSDARAALARHVAVVVPDEDKAQHSQLVAKYVAAAIREDRASRAPVSVFDLVFGPSRRI